jgi:hypothetical protein
MTWRTVAKGLVCSMMERGSAEGYKTSSCKLEYKHGLTIENETCRLLSGLFYTCWKSCWMKGWLDLLREDTKMETSKTSESVGRCAMYD